MLHVVLSIYPLLKPLILIHNHPIDSEFGHSDYTETNILHLSRNTATEMNTKDHVKKTPQAKSCSVNTSFACSFFSKECHVRLEILSDIVIMEFYGKK